MIAMNIILSQLPQYPVLTRVECYVVMVFGKRRVGCMMALWYAVLAFLPVAYIHNLTWPWLFVSVLNFHSITKGRS